MQAGALRKDSNKSHPRDTHKIYIQQCDIVTGHDGHVDYCNRLTCIMFNVVAHMWMVRYGLFWL